MPVAPGTRLGPYEIGELLGAGGMGEVYRARDTRLERDVAVKVLPDALGRGSETLARFEREAKAVAALSHPNILAIHDFGRVDDRSYAVMELLTGETLRSRLDSGAIPARKAIEIAREVAEGLAAAHERDIVHRDLKPENLFLTSQGGVKILDFGLARHDATAGGQDDEAPTQSQHTEPGRVLGTVGYMSPEQVRGRVADHRSDIFSFGVVLYEMLLGRRAFRAGSVAETMSAILKDDPEGLADLQETVPPAVFRIVVHCLEKVPAERFQSARDLAFALESLTRASGVTSPFELPLVRLPRRATRRRLLLGLGAVSTLALSVALGLHLARPTPWLTFQRLTFRRGHVLSARFTPDGQSVVYSAAWDGRPAEVFVTRADSTESRSLGLPAADLLSISPTHELALLLKKGYSAATTGEGTLARVPLNGGAPRDVLDDVSRADFGPSGELAVLRLKDGVKRIDYPIGTELYRSKSSLFGLRVSPHGDTVAFTEFVDGRGSIRTVDRKGTIKIVTEGWAILTSFAFSHDSDELVFSGGRSTADLAVRAVTPSGSLRTLLAGPDQLTVHDAWGGRLLASRETYRLGLVSKSRDADRERDLSYLDRSRLRSLSEDGSMVLFGESGEGGGPNGSVYFRRGGEPPIRLADGSPQGLSPDGRTALVTTPGGQLALVPTGAGESRTIASPARLRIVGAEFLPAPLEGIHFGAIVPGEGLRGFVLSPLDGTPRAFTPAGLVAGGPISPDGAFMAGISPEGTPVRYPLAGGEPVALTGLEPRERAVQWSADGRFLYVMKPGGLPLQITLVEVATGARSPWKELLPVDAPGLLRIDDVVVSRDGRSYAYGYAQAVLSDLYVASPAE